MEDLAYLNALQMVPGIGRVTLNKLLQTMSAREAWFADNIDLTHWLTPRMLEALVQSRTSIDPAAEWERLINMGVRVCCPGQKGYPTSLAEIFDPPVLLYYLGELPQDGLALAVVGSRQASPYGRNAAQLIVRDLVKAGFTIVSGGARGIDSAAHLAALEAGGKTIAVLGNGLDVVYPKENARLFARIQEQGAVVSEYPLGTKPLAGNFPSRNRVISGISLGTLVVEGREKSGSLITADCALEQGREVFAVPGPVTSEGSRGPHKLIKQGAKLVETAADILVEYGYLFPENYQVCLADLTLPPELQDIIAILSFEPVHVDVICRKLASSPEKLAAQLLDLELSGKIKQLSGGYYIKLTV